MAIPIFLTYTAMNDNKYILQSVRKKRTKQNNDIHYRHICTYILNNKTKQQHSLSMYFYSKYIFTASVLAFLLLILVMISMYSLAKLEIKQGATSIAIFHFQT